MSEQPEGTTAGLVLCVFLFIAAFSCCGALAWMNGNRQPTWTRTISTPAPVEDWDVLDQIDKQAKQLRAESLRHLEEKREHGTFQVEMRINEGRKPEKSK